MGQYDPGTRNPATGADPGRTGTPNGGGIHDKVGAEARRFADGARDEARRVVDERRESGAETVDGLARAVRSAADELDRTSPDLARYTREAASMVEDVSDGIRHRSLGDIVRYADDFARREPVAFVGAAALAGFVLTRFLSSSARHIHTARATADHRDMTGAMSASAAPMGSAPTDRPVAPVAAASPVSVSATARTETARPSPAPAAVSAAKGATEGATERERHYGKTAPAAGTAAPGPSAGSRSTAPANPAPSPREEVIRHGRQDP